MKIKHECAWSTCHTLVDSGEKYCPRHRKKGEQNDQYRNGEYQKSYNKTRYEKNPLTANYHTTRWRKLRLTVLARDNYLCQECLKHNKITTASQVDHKKSAVTRPDLFWNMDNLWSLCESCHSHKTIEEQKKRKRGQ